MAFLFKSKNKDREKARDAAPGSSGAASGRANSSRDEKNSLQRSTPTGSLNSLDVDAMSNSPEAFPRRGASVDQQPQAQSDLPVSRKLSYLALFLLFFVLSLFPCRRLIQLVLLVSKWPSRL